MSRRSLARRLTLPLALALLALLVGIAAAPAAASVRLPLRLVPPPGSRPAGDLPAQAGLRLTVVLAPRDPLALQAYALAVSTPGSPLYHRYLSVAEFARRFAPAPGTIQQVRASLRAHGLSPGALTTNGLAIPVRTTAAGAARAFAVGFRRLALSGGRRGFLATAAPAVDPAIAPHVQAILGLSSSPALHPADLRLARHPHAAVAHVVTGGPQGCAAARASGAYTADQIAAAYRFSGLYGAGDQGAGQTIAVYELEPFDPADIQAYQACYGTSVPVSTVAVDGGAGSGSGAGEAALDIEDVIGLAPRAQVLVYSGPNGSDPLGSNGPYDTYARFVSDNRAKILSTSWGICESQLGSSDAAAENTLFQEAAVQGQAVLAASGDTGAQACTTAAGIPEPVEGVDDPAGQPFVTGVGGTSMPSFGPPPQESVWNDGSGASGGGVSALWPMPSYQSSAPAALHVINGGSSRSACGSSSAYCREVPDVAADADPATGYAIYYQGKWMGAGGTSASAPTFAALLALANASPGCSGAAVGFANPALYRAAAASYTGAYNDVQRGTNDLLGTGGFAASAGYDMATGLGTPSGTTLAQALCDRVTMASTGGQSSVQGQRVGLTLRGASSSGLPVAFATSGLPPGLSLSGHTISGTAAAAGVFTVHAIAYDAYAASSQVTFSWVVRRPVLTLAGVRNQTARVGQRVSLRLRGAVNNGQAVTYSARGLPPGLGLNRRTGVISGRPRRAGRYHVSVRCSYGSAPSPTHRFTWAIARRR